MKTVLLSGVVNIFSMWIFIAATGRLKICIAGFQTACMVWVISMRPLQIPYLWYISSLCAAQNLAYLYDMSAIFVLL
ncbi:hypothetical protein ACOR62_06625 [Neisseria lisongii]|uniref:Uncharacterized protein n=1 Tax=Neisseria lisongii TaxID=2912188 RepID=A0AAW5AGI7_9NEIS|nr:hypothetical protein [Neisseria lisongii]MCF7528907.1 hypothetical protein [Neisseria lisongii]